MSNYTADEVELMADWVYSHGRSTGNAVPMMREFARRLRQEEEENRRDPVKEPRPGDRMITPCGWEWVCIEHEKRSTACSVGHFKQEGEKFPGATIIRRREVQP